MGQASQKCTADRKITAQKNHEIRETAYHLVVKIIQWRSGIKGPKITSKEWREYKKHLLASISAEETKKYQQTLTRLRETQQAIVKYGGFVEI